MPTDSSRRERGRRARDRRSDPDGSRSWHPRYRRPTAHLPDDRRPHTTVSSHQVDGFGVWDRGSNDTRWDALLGDRRKTEAVSIYGAPSRATDLTNLPPTFIDVTSAEVFRDEDLAYANAAHFLRCTQSPVGSMGHTSWPVALDTPHSH